MIHTAELTAAVANARHQFLCATASEVQAWCGRFRWVDAPNGGLPPPAGPALGELLVWVHRVSGSSSVFGLERVVDVARQLELACTRPSVAEGATQVVQNLLALSNAVAQELQQAREAR